MGLRTNVYGRWESATASDRGPQTQTPAMVSAIPFCDTPGQSAIIGVLAGLAGGLAGLALGLETVGVVAVATVLALTVDVGAHLLRGDDQYRAAVRQVTREG